MLFLYVCYEVLTPMEIKTCLLVHFLDLKVIKVTNKYCLFFTQNSSPPRIPQNSCNKLSEREVPLILWETEVSYRNVAFSWHQVPCCQGN